MRDWEARLLQESQEGAVTKGEGVGISDETMGLLPGMLLCSKKRVTLRVLVRGCRELAVEISGWGMRILEDSLGTYVRRREMLPQEVPCMCSAYAYRCVSPQGGGEAWCSVDKTGKDARALEEWVTGRQSWLTDHMRRLAAHHRGEG